MNVNGTPLEDDDYGVVSGSTKVTLKKAYLDTLSVGEYDVGILFNDGNFTSTKLTIAESSGDGGSNTMMFVAIGAVIAVVALVAVYFVFVRKP